MPIRFTLADHVARITIDRPEVMNAIDVASERELQRIWLEIEGNRESGADRTGMDDQNDVALRQCC